MSDPWDSLAAFLIDTERLKLVERSAWVSDRSRHENSAEHSWHLTLGMLALARELNLSIDLDKALRMALVHDLCEIDAGDASVFDVAARAAKAQAERDCMARLAACGLAIGPELENLWYEYEAQETVESRWVRVMDRLMPFVVNLANGGQAWKDRAITRTQVVHVNEPVRRHAPELFDWMLKRIEECVARGWIVDA